LAINYYNLGSDAKLSDVIKCVRADEQHHSQTNHNYANNF
jgi:ubiquinol oxidase